MAQSTDSPMASSTCFKGLGEPPGGPDNAAPYSDTPFEAGPWCWLQMQAVTCSQSLCSGPHTAEPCKEGRARVKVVALDLHRHVSLSPSPGRLAFLKVLS